MQRNAFIQSWRQGLSLSLEDVASRSELSEATLIGIEAGTLDPSVDQLESLARTLGLRGELLYDEDIGTSAGTDVLRVLFKSAEGLAPPPNTRFQMLDAARAALDLLELHDALKVPGPAVPSLHVPAKPREALHKLAARQAVALRTSLGLGKGPVESMRDLISIRLRIPLLAAHLGSHGPDAFSVFAPGGRVAIVLNVDGKHQNLLVRPFTLAHELGHVLSDKPRQGGTGLACLIDSQRELDIETRANAFAIRLLLTAEVDRLKDDLLDPSTFRAVMERWSIHYSALRLFTKNLLGLTDDAMAKKAPNVDTTAPLRVRDAEELEAERSTATAVPMPRRGELTRLVLQELAGGRMSKGRARELLRVDATLDLDALVQSTGVA